LEGGTHLKKSVQETMEGNIVWRAIHKGIGAFITINLMVTVSLVFFIVLMRYVFKMNLYGADELVTLFAMWLYFCGAIYGSYEESHIKGDLLTMLFKKKIHYKIHQIYVYLFCLIVLGIWCYWSLDYAGTIMRSTRATTGLKIPFWLNQLPIIVGLWGMFLYSIYHFIKNIFKKPEEYMTADEAVQDALEESVSDQKGGGQK
jgi:TRAP-type C4-dicarboxylate transport system permease small subunit